MYRGMLKKEGVLRRKTNLEEGRKA